MLADNGPVPYIAQDFSFQRAVQLLLYEGVVSATRRAIEVSEFDDFDWRLWVADRVRCRQEVGNFLDLGRGLCRYYFSRADCQMIAICATSRYENKENQTIRRKAPMSAALLACLCHAPCVHQ